MQILNGKKIDSKKNGKKNGKKIDSKRRNKEWKKIIQNEEILSDLELDKWSPPHPHRVEAYSTHLPDAFNSRSAELGSSRTQKLEKSLKKRKKH